MKSNAFYEPYPEYKPSGVEWLGDVPAHWSVVQLGRIGRFQKCSGGTKADEVLEGIPCVRYGDLYTSHRTFVEHTRSFITEDKVGEYTPLKYGDILFAGSGETIEEIGISAVNLIESQVRGGGDIILFRPQLPIDARFSGYLLDSSQSRFQKSCMGRGITVMHVYASELKYLWLSIPPLDEQPAIVRYLDQADERIQRTISAKEHLIELLTEQRQATIHLAVTRGLDPNVRLKDSGVEWLGDVPEHWEVRRLKTLCNMKSGDGITAESIEPSGEYPVYGGNGLRGHTSAYTHDGDFVLIGRQGALCGNVHIARSKFWASEHAVVATLAVPHVVEWFAATLDVMNLNQYSISAAQPGLAVERVLNLSLPVPPNHEQIRIAHCIGKATADIDTAIDKAQRQIDLLREYHMRLIADV